MNGYDRTTYNKVDSVFIDASTEKLIVVQSKGLSRISNYKENETNLREFKSFEVYQTNIESKSDFLLSNKWVYSEKDAHNAVYVCYVTQSDF